MANLRESYAATGYASLEWSELGEKAIDRVAASGKCSKLGVSLWKAKFLLESAAYQKAQRELLLVYKTRYFHDDQIIGEALVSQALVEYIAPQCRVCNGEGERIVNDLKVVCEACSGSKMHRYSDKERALRMQMSYGRTKASAHKLRWLLNFMQDEDRTVNLQMNVELERPA
jgi:hypothetical protein